MEHLSAVGAEPFDQRALGALFQAHKDLLERLCARWMHGRCSDADDLFGEACLKAIEATRRTQVPIADPVAWLSTIIANLARDRLRARDRERSKRAGDGDALESVPDRGSASDNVIAAKQQLAHALKVLPALSRAQRIALVARSNGEGYAVIARRLGTSQVNARKLVQVARERLRVEGLPSRLFRGAGNGPTPESIVAA